ncbi:MAG: tetratricopeptide repeat protein [Methyloligellaceae bacterium]
MSLRQIEDSQGLVFSAPNAEAVQRFDNVVTAYLGFKSDIGEKLKSLLAEAPDMPMAVCLRGYLTKLVGNKFTDEKAKTIADTLAVHGQLPNITPREKNHIMGLGSWVSGDLDRATKYWESILTDYPTDTLALRLVHHLHFYSGQGSRMLDSIERVFPKWHVQHPHYGYVLGMNAFSHEEAGDYAKAEQFGREAVAINPADAWSTHAVAHVHEMNGLLVEGIDWISANQTAWSDVNNFRFHVYWHKSLFHLERTEYNEVLNLYDNVIASDLDADFSLDVCNATSLLLRLEMHGVEVGDRWAQLAEVSRKHLSDRDMIFTTLHYLMALVASNDQEAINTMLDNIRNWSKEESTQGRICAEVGLGLAEALVSLRAAKYEEAAQALMTHRKNTHRIGGSIAQRDLFEMLLLHAATKGERTDWGSNLAKQRKDDRPKSLWSWQTFAGCLDSEIDSNAYVEAQRNIDLIKRSLGH